MAKKRFFPIQHGCLDSTLYLKHCLRVVPIPTSTSKGWKNSSRKYDDDWNGYCEMNTHFDVSDINHLWPRIRGCCQRLLRMMHTHNRTLFSPFSFTASHIVWKLLKMSQLNFWILAFSTNFCPIKTDLSGNTVWPQASDFQKYTIFGIFNLLLAICFARNVEWDFFSDFQTQC